MSGAEWIAKRRELLAAASEGPWLQDADDPGLVWGAVASLLGHDAAVQPSDAALIADAPTSLPLALDALEAVLALRPPAGSEKFGPDFEVGVAKGMQLARAAIETALGASREPQ